MASFQERWKIERDSQIDPDTVDLPSDTTPAEVTSANAFRVKVRQSLLDLVEERMAMAVPTDGAAQAQLAYLRSVLEQPDSVTLTIMRLMLSRFDTLTSAQIFNATDQQIRDGILAVLPTLAAGRSLRRV